MALITNNIYEARSAYSTLEMLAQASQQNVVTLQATVDNLTAVHARLVDSVRLQGEFTASQISTNGQLTAQQATAVSPDVSLDNFIASLGLSIALAEATMPDRTISGVAATVQSYLTFSTGPDGVTKIPGLRLYQPELGEPTALATTSFELAKTVSADAPAPRSLYTVLLAKQAAFSDPFWAKFSSGSPPTQPAVSIVSEVGKVFSMIGNWSFPYLLTEAGVIADLEATLAGLLEAAPQDAVAAYTASVQSLTDLIQAIGARSLHVAGDLFALTSALDTTTTRAVALIP